MQHDKMNDLKRPEVKVGRKEKDKCGEQLAERSIYLAEPEVCFWCFLPVKTLENWEPIYIYMYIQYNQNVSKFRIFSIVSKRKRVQIGH